MTRIGLDTNVVVSFLTDRDPGQQARAAALFGGAASGAHVVVLAQAVVVETVYVLCNLYGVAPDRASRTMRDLVELPGVMVVDALEWAEVWRLWPHHLGDFGDACLAASARADAFDTLATFDTGFAKRARRQSVPTYW